MTHPSFNKKRRFNPHHIWAIFCSVFIIALIGLLVYFSWYFISTTDRLDGPATTTLETNAARITAMQHTLTTIEAAVSARTGQSSQKSTSVVQ